MPSSNYLFIGANQFITTLHCIALIDLNGIKDSAQRTKTLTYLQLHDKQVFAHSKNN